MNKKSVEKCPYINLTFDKCDLLAQILLIHGV